MDFTAFLICLTENGTVLHEMYVDRSSNEIIEIDYTNGMALIEKIKGGVR